MATAHWYNTISDDEIAALFDPATHKRRAPRPRPVETSVASGPAASGPVAAGRVSEACRLASGQVVHDGVEDETYEVMLERAHHKMRASNPFLAERQKLKLKPPKVERLGSTRSVWENFKDIVDALKRDISHVKDFFLAELGTTGSIDGKLHLVLKGRHTTTSVQSLVSKYVEAYCQCANCKGVNTVLEKNSLRLTTLKCNDCSASRTVAAVTQGTKVVRRGERRKQRAAAV